MAVNSERLKRSLDFLKSEFFTAGEKWVRTRDSKLVEELNALGIWALDDGKKKK